MDETVTYPEVVQGSVVLGALKLAGANPPHSAFYFNLASAAVAVASPGSARRIVSYAARASARWPSIV